MIREAVKNEFEIKLNDNKLKNQKEQEQLKLDQFKTTSIIIGISVILVRILLFYGRNIIKINNEKRRELLDELELLKKDDSSGIIVDVSNFELNRVTLEKSIDRKLNDTDWNVLNILLESPEVTNKVIAEKAFLSIDGIGSSLRRMYDYFEIEKTKYKKIALIKEAIERSRKA